MPIVKAIYHVLFRTTLRLRFWFSDRLGVPPSDVALPPSILRYRVCESLSVSEFLQVGEACADLIKQQVNEAGIDFAGAHRILDFGCGCGRTMRWLLQNRGGTEFHGTDVDADAVEWCKTRLQQGHFQANRLHPQLRYPAQHFDVIYCLPVFTHLYESMQDSWLAELRRILKPGGILLLTIYGKSATKGLDEQGRKSRQLHGFVHRRSRKLKGLLPDWYQTTWHSRQYIVNRLAGSFEDIRYTEVPGGLQDILTARRAGS